MFHHDDLNAATQASHRNPNGAAWYSGAGDRSKSVGSRAVITGNALAAERDAGQ
jgi:hypothetical protein